MHAAAAQRATAARAPRSLGPGLVPWVVVLIGFAALFAPVYWTAANSYWQSDEFGHAPLILGIALWLFWRQREHLNFDRAQPAWWPGAIMLALGLLAYLMGRSLTIGSAEFVAHWLVVGAAILLLVGPTALRKCRFAWLYLLFMVPLPASLIDAVTGPLKQWISAIVVDGLYALGYPIARAGVVISIGSYQLLVADACSGLNSMFSLAALGTLYIHIVSAQRSTLHNAILVAAIIPIAFMANIVRVATLVLVTFHFGDEAGQGFLHGAAGFLLMGVALAAFMLLDFVLSLVLTPPSSRRSREPRAGSASASRRSTPKVS